MYLEWGPINGQERKVVGISMKKPGGEFCFIIMDRFIYTGIFIPSVVKRLIELFMLFSANFIPKDGPFLYSIYGIVKDIGI